ncbi:MAG: type II toxin-antitoxin system VapC family toxin [Acidimicrobiaceae bacterium]|nr:type II toxin-antitoxin system VapC family toxin [Acidimicrobiaceae bacterium]
MIVVDSSVAVQALLDDKEALHYVNAGKLIAPHLIEVEVLHAMRRLEAQKGEDTVDANCFIRRWKRFDVQLFDIRGLLKRVWALRHNISAYDASYVASAEFLNCPLVTTDKRLAAAPGPTCIITLIAD